MKKYFLLIFVITLLASSTVVFGQEPNITSEPTKPTSNNPINQADIDQMLMNDFNGQNTFIPGFLGCSDLSTNVSLELSTVNKINSSGVNVDIRGKIKNGNKFPIINGTLLVKIFIKNG